MFHALQQDAVVQTTFDLETLTTDNLTYREHNVDNKISKPSSRTTVFMDDHKIPTSENRSTQTAMIDEKPKSRNSVTRTIVAKPLETVWFKYSAEKSDGCGESYEAERDFDALPMSKAQPGRSNGDVLDLVEQQSASPQPFHTTHDVASEVQEATGNRSSGKERHIRPSCHYAKDAANSQMHFKGKHLPVPQSHSSPTRVSGAIGQVGRMELVDGHKWRYIYIYSLAIISFLHFKM